MRQKFLQWDIKYTTLLRVADRPGWLRNSAALLAHSGDSWFWLLGLGLLWLLGPFHWRSHAQTLVTGVILTAVLVIVIKFSVRRKRPEGVWGRIYRNTDPHSFPSGHAARAAALAVLVIELGLPWLGLILVLWAPLVSLARVAMGVHYLSDVLAGIALGIGIGLGLAQFL
jgi:membrane-associated phospholipid phosphatase